LRRIASQAAQFFGLLRSAFALLFGLQGLIWVCPVEKVAKRV
jgi:hypothetical protein